MTLHVVGVDGARAGDESRLLLGLPVFSRDGAVFAARSTHWSLSRDVIAVDRPFEGGVTETQSQLELQEGELLAVAGDRLVEFLREHAPEETVFNDFTKEPSGFWLRPVSLDDYAARCASVARILTPLCERGLGTGDVHEAKRVWSLLSGLPLDDLERAVLEILVLRETERDGAAMTSALAFHSRRTNVGAQELHDHVVLRAQAARERYELNPVLGDEVERAMVRAVASAQTEILHASVSPPVAGRQLKPEIFTDALRKALRSSPGLVVRYIWTADEVRQHRVAELKREFRGRFLDKRIAQKAIGARPYNFLIVDGRMYLVVRSPAERPLLMAISDGSVVDGYRRWFEERFPSAVSETVAN